MSRELPTWAWVTLGVVGVAAVGGAIGAVVWRARHPAFDDFIRQAGAPAELGPFAAVQRFTESGGNPRAGLGRPELFPDFAEPRLSASLAERENEHAAAVTAYDRNRDAYAESPFPRAMWIFGSGGPYGLIPANALAPFRDTPALRAGKVGPWDVFNPWKSTVLWLDMIQRLMRWDAFQDLPPDAKNWLAIKRGMARPSLMADYAETQSRSRTVRSRAEKAAEALKIDPGFLRERVPEQWPSYRGAVELLG
jgi:hypothetical protein